MARIKNGNISGKVGNLVGYERKGKNYFKKAPHRTAPPTEGELKSRFKMELVSGWLRPIAAVVRKGFRNYSWNFEGFSAAFSVVYKEALVDEGMNSSIDPALVKISSGDLGMPEDLQVSLNPQQELEFSWTPSINQQQSPRDRILLLAYNIEAEHAVYQLSGAIRYAGNDQLSLAAAPKGSYHIYAAFTAEDGSRQSESKYLGNYEL